MNSSISVVRAITGEITNRVYFPVLITALIIAVGLVGLIIWLATISLWWLLLGIPVLIAIVIGGTILIVTRILVAIVIPAQTKAQRRDVKKFTDKLLIVSELTQTPKFILLFRVVKDVLAPKKANYIETVILDTVSLRKDFNALRRSFE